MNTSKLTSDFIFAVLAQGLNALTSTLLTLALPKVLGIEDFGYWQLFIFYAGYVGFFHLGLNDGVYLINGGAKRNEIDKPAIKSQFLLGTFAQLAFSVLAITVSLMVSSDENRSFVISMTATLITINNAGAFLGYLFQAMGETRRFSLSIVIESAALLTGIGLLMAFGTSDYKAYVVLYFASKTICLAYCCVRNIDLLKARSKPITKAAQLSISSIRVGFKLMIANTAGSLILGIARFLIDANWGIEVFSAVSFALSIASFFMMFISQASMVLFPALRQTTEQEASDFFEKARDLLDVALPATLFLYWPGIYMLGIWLPDYVASLAYFAFVFPLCIYEGKMDILGTTYLKVFRNESRLLAINLFALLASTALALAGVYLLHSIEFILAGIILILGFRELYTEALISKKLKLKQSKMSFALLPLCLCFSLLCIGAPFGWAAVTYLVLYVIYMALFKNERKNAWRLIKARLSKHNRG